MGARYSDSEIIEPQPGLFERLAGPLLSLSNFYESASTVQKRKERSLVRGPTDVLARKGLWLGRDRPVADGRDF